ncbi:MAG: YlmH/Sll1252 family protein [Sporolactobacillus sp.]
MTVFEHFRTEERPLVERFLDMKEQVSRTYTSQFTDFLDPREQVIARSVIGQQDDLRLIFSGGYPAAERKRALLLAPYAEEADYPFAISCLEIDYPSKFVSLTHPQVLGAVLGTGIVRRKIGDFIFSEGRVLLLCTRDVAPYLMTALTSVGRQKVATRETSGDHLPQTAPEWAEQAGTVSSMRLDAVIAEIYHLSRANSAEPIERGHVKVNYQLIDKRDFVLHSGDMLSLRGHGRSKIISASGLTKKNKIRLVYGKLN